MITARFEVSLALPYCLALPERAYRVRVGPSECAITTKTHNLTVGTPLEDGASIAFDPFSGQVAEASGVHVPGAMLRYTEVAITFGRYVSSADAPETDWHAVVSFAHRCLGRFLEVYRFVAREPLVRPLSLSEMHAVRAGRAMVVGRQFVEGGSMKTQQGPLFSESAPIEAGPLRLLDDPTVKTFSDRLAAGSSLRLHVVLLLNAQAYISTGENRLAVVEMNTALDTLVERRTNQLLRREPAAWRERLPKRFRKEPEIMSTRDRLAHVLVPSLILPPEVAFPWQAWNETHRPLRNRVIHDGYEPTSDEVSASFADVSAMCKVLEDVVPGPGPEPGAGGVSTAD